MTASPQGVINRKGLTSSQFRFEYVIDMALELFDLDEQCRQQMLAELEKDEGGEGVYLSPRLSPEGAGAYPGFLRQAITDGDDGVLEVSLSRPGMFKATETYERDGVLRTRKMNRRAPQTLAEGEFNRFFIRGLCASICADGGGVVEVYRARESSWARPESQALIGTRIDAEALLQDLRESAGAAPSLLPDVNSGLSVRRPGL